MLFYILIAAVVMIFLWALLTKESNPGEILFIFAGIATLILLAVGIVATITDDDTETVWHMDTDTIQNERFGDDNNYYAMVDGSRFNLSDGSNTTFDIGSSNTITKSCDYTPAWVIPWTAGPCTWDIEAEHVE